MCTFPDFYKKHMALCVGICPVVTLNHLDNKLIKTFGQNQKLVKVYEKMCPGILKKAAN